MFLGGGMSTNDIHEIYDYIVENKVCDIYDLIHAAFTPQDVKINWLELLSDDKLVDLFNLKINENNHKKNRNLIQRYYDEFIGCV